MGKVFDNQNHSIYSNKQQNHLNLLNLIMKSKVNLKVLFSIFNKFFNINSLKSIKTDC
jgi:hypothetical protein